MNVSGPEVAVWPVSQQSEVFFCGSGSWLRSCSDSQFRTPITVREAHKAREDCPRPAPACWGLHTVTACKQTRRHTPHTGRCAQAPDTPKHSRHHKLFHTWDAHVRARRHRPLVVSCPHVSCRQQHDGGQPTIKQETLSITVCAHTLPNSASNKTPQNAVLRSCAHSPMTLAAVGQNQLHTCTPPQQLLYTPPAPGTACAMRHTHPCTKQEWNRKLTATYQGAPGFRCVSLHPCHTCRPDTPDT
jgi:hypothetical protein